MKSYKELSIFLELNSLDKMWLEKLAELVLYREERKKEEERA